MGLMSLCVCVFDVVEVVITIVCGLWLASGGLSNFHCFLEEQDGGVVGSYVLAPPSFWL